MIFDTESVFSPAPCFAPTVSQKKKALPIVWAIPYTDFVFYHLLFSIFEQVSIQYLLIYPAQLLAYRQGDRQVSLAKDT